MSRDAKVEANEFHAGPLCLFFSWRMKVVRAHVGPFFLFFSFFWSMSQIFFWDMDKSLEWNHLQYFYLIQDFNLLHWKLCKCSF
jgi:hypothetical protein